MTNRHQRLATHGKKLSKESFLRKESELRNIAMAASIVGNTASSMVVLAFAHSVARASGISPAELEKHFRDVLAESNLPAECDAHVRDVLATLEQRTGSFGAKEPVSPGASAIQQPVADTAARAAGVSEVVT